MKVLYALPWFRANTGQETRLAQIIRYGQNKWESALMSNSFFLLPGSFPSETNVNVLKSRYYYSLFLNPFPIRSEVRKFDIFHIESGIPYLYAARSIRVPKIYTLHGESEHYDRSIINRFREPVANRLESILVSFADAVIGVSEWVCKFYKEKYGFDILYVPDSVDLSLFQYRKKIPNREILKLTIVGGWDGFSGRKRQHEFLDLMPSLIHSFPGVTLKLVGLRAEQIDSLRSIVYKKGLMKYVVFIGKISDSELASHISCTDILVVTSLWEGFHRPTIEAMASGVPVLARSPEVGINEQNVAHYLHVKNSGGGATFYMSGDDAIAKIWNILDNYSEMAYKGYEYAKKFDNKVVLPKYENLYKQLL